MAKIHALHLTTRAATGATLIVRDFMAMPDADGELPPLRAADGAPCTITVQGIDAPAAKRFQQLRAAETQNRAYAAMLGSKKAETTVLVSADDVAEVEEAEVALLATLTTGWSGFEDDADQAIPFSQEAARSLYAACPPIRAQVLAFVNDRQRFFGSSATPAAPSPRTSSASADASAS